MKTSKIIAATALLLACASGCAANTDATGASADVGSTSQAMTVGQDVHPSTDGQAGGLYVGYNSRTGGFVGRRCLVEKAPPMIGGGGTSSIDFKKQSSTESTMQDLDIDIDAQANFGMWSASGKFAFARHAASSETSISYVYRNQISQPSVSATDYDLTDFAKGIANDPAKFLSVCGDQVVTTVHKGASLYIDYRLDFTDASTKASFDTEFGIASDFGSLDAKLRTMSSKYAGKLSISMDAFQVGGDVTKINDMVDAMNATKCDVSNMDACSAMMNKALGYAKEFGNSLTTANGADTAYTLQSFSSLGYGQDIASTPATIVSAQQTIEKELGARIPLKLRLDRVGATDDAGILAATQMLSSDHQKLVDANKACTDDVRGVLDGADPKAAACVKAVHDMALNDPAKIGALIDGAHIGPFANKAIRLAAPWHGTSDRVCVDDAWGHDNDGNPVGANICNHNPLGESWSLSADGKIRLDNAPRVVCLDIFHQDKIENTKVQVYDCSVSTTTWRFDSKHRLVGNNGTLCLTARSLESSQNQLVMQTCSDEPEVLARQQWEAVDLNAK